MLHLLQQGAEVTYGLVESLNEICHGSLIEGLIVAMALHIYLFHFHSTWCIGGKKKGSIAARKRNASPSLRAKSHCDATNDTKQVQRLVCSLLGKSLKNLPDVLIQYKTLVHSRRVDLRQHVPDEQNARAMYIALIGAGINAASQQQGSTEGVWRETLRLLTDMRRFGFLRSLEFYATLMKLHAQAQFMQETLWLHNEMLADGIAPDSNIYNMLLNVSTSIGDSEKALSISDSLSKLGAMSVRTYMTILRAYARNKDWKGAMLVLDRMEADGTAADALILNNVLGLCVSVGQVESAESLLPRYKGVVDAVSCNILLKGFTQQADFQKAEILLSKMISDGPTPNLITFNTVMDCAVRALQVLGGSGNVEKACGSGGSGGIAKSSSFLALTRRPWELLDKMDELGLEPDRYTCSTLVKGMHLAGCSRADIHRAVALIRRVGAVVLLGGPSNLQHSTSSQGGQGCGNGRLVEVLFNTLLDACATVRDLELMGEIFTQMQDFKVQRSAVTYGTLIKAFGQAGRLTRCNEVWEDMLNKGIKPTIVTFGCYMDACIRNEDLAGASALFDMMSGRGVRPNAVVYTSLIRGFAQAKLPGKALELYRRMRTEGIEATSVTFNSVLDVVARQLTEPALLQEVVDDMREAKIEPDVVTYSILLKASCSTGNLESALSLFRQIRSHGLAFDQVAFNTLMQACSKANQLSEAEEVFEEMLRMGVLPSHVTTSILVKMYGKAHMLEKAIAVSERMEREYGRVPNLFVCTCLIQACVQNKHVRRSWEIFNSMLRAGVEPDAITYGTVIHGCVYLNRFEHALSLVRHAYMCPRKASADAVFDEAPFAVDAIPLKHVIPLQPEVLQMLLAALRRKEQPLLAAELADIIAEQPTLQNQGNGPRRPRGRNAVT